MTIIPIFSLKIAATDRDFLFEPVRLEQLSLFAHIVNTGVSSILVKNTTNKSVILPKNTCLGHLCELGTEQGLIAMAFTGILEEDLFSLAERMSSNSRSPNWFTNTLSILRTAYNVSTDSGESSKASQETVLPNGVAIYGKSTSHEVQ